MLFNTLSFAIFFVIVYQLYWINFKNYKRQNLILLIASYIFYGCWDARFLVLLVFATVIDYSATILIDKKKLDLLSKIKSYGALLLSVFILVLISKANVFKGIPFFDNIRHDSNYKFDWWLLLYTSLYLFLFDILQYSIHKMDCKFQEKIYLFWSIANSLLVLCIFKYFNFFADNFILFWSYLFGHEPSELTFKIVLPVGISFFIFQTISHTIDVYNKKITSTDSLIELGVYIAFFPQLVAGPIERGSHLLPQFQKARSINIEDKKEAYWLIAWGLYKKVVVADNVARIVNTVFHPYDTLVSVSNVNEGLLCLISIYAFAIQIYCDFSGYTDIARGTARLLGFDIMLNFKLPYFAINPSEFWRRWHISLSSWLRDYLYIPLGGNRNGKYKTNRNLMITMLLGGLWHGAAWNFIYWGVFHGFLLIIYNLLSKETNIKNTNSSVILKSVVMFHFVCFGWLLFRAKNMSTVYIFLSSIITNFNWSIDSILQLENLLFYSWFLIFIQILQAFYGELNIHKSIPRFASLNIWIFILTSIICLSGKNAQEFIYFAF